MKWARTQCSRSGNIPKRIENDGFWFGKKKLTRQTHVRTSGQGRKCVPIANAGGHDDNVILLLVLRVCAIHRGGRLRPTRYFRIIKVRTLQEPVY